MKRFKCVIWGCGTMGRRVADLIGADKVAAFIDTNEALQDTSYRGIPIISLNTYMLHYSGYIIIVSPKNHGSVIEMLHNHDIYQYLILEHCPPEMWWVKMKDVISDFPYEFHKNEVVYGISLYSILLSEKNYSKKKNYVPIIAQKTMDLNRENAIRSRIPQIQIISYNCFNDILKKTNTIYVADHIELSEIEKECMKNNTACINIYDLSKTMCEYHNDKLKAFKDIHKGKRIFIICTGSSLRMEDLDKLKCHNEICIGMNGIFKAYSETDWRPNYFVVQDRKTIELYQQDIIDMQVEVKFIADSYKEFWDIEHPANIYKIHTRIVDLRQEQSEFSDDISCVIYDSYTVTYSCMQIAAYMGAAEIILLGCDFNYFQDQRDPKAYFISSYNDKVPIEVKIASNKEGHYKGYLGAKKYADEHGIKIYNATRGGELEVFDRIDFDSLFYG